MRRTFSKFCFFLIILIMVPGSALRLVRSINTATGHRPQLGHRVFLCRLGGRLPF